MFSSKTKIGAGVVLAFAGALALSACASGSGGTTSSTPDMSDAPMASSSSTPMASASMDPMADLVGSGCADYAAANATGAGSVEGMSQDPVATAASNNPLLTTLTATVTGAYNPGVNLVDTLNSSTAEYTVFAPVDSAFAKIDAATLDSLKTDSATLTKILTYHVLPERLNPSDIDGTHATVEGGTLEVTGSGNNIMINGSSAVICGGVQTANATVYLIDTVLMPPM